MAEPDSPDGSVFDVIIIGGGVAGRTAAIFTARHGLQTLVIDSGSSIVRRNAHLENVPGFPAGVNPRHFLELLSEQARSAGTDWLEERVSEVAETADGFAITTAAAEVYHSSTVIVATKNDVTFLSNIEGIGIIERGKTFLDVDDRGRTGVKGLYAAGRVAEKPHQVAVCAGHGAEVAITILEDDERPFYHDWVAPEGYFSDRGRDIPPGCEEIDADERNEREATSLTVMQERFSEPHPDAQETHPRLED